VAPVPPADTASNLKLVPLSPEERKQQVGAVTEPDVTVHLEIPAAKK
jgi:hypothetical protein